MDILKNKGHALNTSGGEKRKLSGLTCAFKKLIGLAALYAFAAALTLPQGARAEERLLARAGVELSEGKVQAELWGDTLKNGYARKLMLLLKQDGRVIGAYAPSVPGGYNCLLEPVRVKKEGPEQLLLSAGQGDWRAPTEYRVLDFSDLKKIREVFSGAQNVGLIVSAAFADASGSALELKLSDGTINPVELGFEAFDAAGLYYGGLDSLTPYDIDGDGCQELFASQQLATRSRLLLDVGWAFKLSDDGSWQAGGITILKNTAGAGSGGINEGHHWAWGSLLARKLVTDFGEATFPVFAGPDPKLQDNINEILGRELAGYLRLFFAGRSDLAFRVLRADSMLLTLQLILSRDGTFSYHSINIDPATGRGLALADILNVKGKGLLKALSGSCEKPLTEIPDEWFIKDGRLHLLRGTGGVEDAVIVELEQLSKYLRDKKWLPQKLTDQSANKEKQRKQEKKKEIES